MANKIDVVHSQGMKISSTEFAGDAVTIHMNAGGLIVTDGDKFLAAFNEKNWIEAHNKD